jgi:hypothetical protein
MSAVQEGRRTGHPVDIGDVAAYQYVAAGHEALEQRSGERIAEQVDGEFRVERAIDVFGVTECQAATVVGEGGVGRSHADGQRRWLTGLAHGPAAHRVVFLHHPDAGRRRPAPGQPRLEPAEEFLLPDGDLVGIVGVAAERQVSGRSHRAQRADQLLVFRLRLVHQDVDADRLGAKRVDLGQRLGQQGSVQGRAALGVLQRIVVEHHHDDPVVLIHRRRGQHHAQVVERPLGGAE